MERRTKTYTGKRFGLANNNISPTLVKVMDYNINLYTLSMLLLVAWITSCTTITNSSVTHCETSPEFEKRIECYWLEMRASISAQLDSDYRTYIDINCPLYPECRPIFRPLYAANADVNLTPDGEIKSIIIARSSGDGEFDKFLIQTIKNAAPFLLPPKTRL